MAKKLSVDNNYFLITDTISGDTTEYPCKYIRYKDYNNGITFSYINDDSQNVSLDYADIVDSTGVSFSTTADLLSWLRLNTGESNYIDTYLQDQTSPVIINNFSKQDNQTTTTSLGAIGNYTFDVALVTGFTAGKYISLFSVPDNRFMVANILSVAGNTITIDMPLDFAYPIGTYATAGSKEMNVNGSVTPVIFGIRNTTETIGSSLDVTRIVFRCLTATPIDLSKFGDIAGGLTRGLVLRKKDGLYRNIFNVKTNADIAGIMFDFTSEQAINPAQGRDGFYSRLTFAGQDKIGVVLRLTPGEDLQFIIQDNLTTLTSLQVVAEGHLVVD